MQLPLLPELWLLLKASGVLQPLSPKAVVQPCGEREDLLLSGIFLALVLAAAPPVSVWDMWWLCSYCCLLSSCVQPRPEGWGSWKVTAGWRKCPAPPAPEHGHGDPWLRDAARLVGFVPPAAGAGSDLLLSSQLPWSGVQGCRLPSLGPRSCSCRAGAS